MRVSSGVFNYQHLGYNFAHGVANNGNVAAINDLLNAGRTQSFTYDEVNRLQTAQSQAGSGADCWGLAFGGACPEAAQRTEGTFGPT